MEEADVDQSPIEQSIVVRSGIDHTFTVFTREIGRWWPTRPFSLGQARVQDVVFEPHVGGRVYEVWDDGTEQTWGHVLVWDPPTRFRITWEILPEVTEVDVRFRQLGDRLTRVELEHSGWERLTKAQIAAATDVEGGYRAGWHHILTTFAAAVAV